MPPVQTEFQAHVARWRGGCGSCLCPLALRVVHLRGTCPCDVLFVGEAPGDSEDATGIPFIGPAGRLQDRIIAEAFAPFPGVTYGLCNLVGCFPVEAKRAGVNEPDSASIKQCRPRLLELIRICRPRVVVNVGRLSEKWLPSGVVCDAGIDWLPPEQPAIVWTQHTHPAAIIKGNTISRDMMTKRCVVAVQNAISEMLNPPPF